MTAADLAALERMLAKATPRWTLSTRLDAGYGRQIATDGLEHIRVSTPSSYSVDGVHRVTAAQRDADAALIVAMRNALPELIAAARERDELAAQAHGAIAGLLALNNMVTADSSEPTSAAVQRVLAERDALRAEVEHMRAVVEAARLLFATLNADEAGIWQVIETSGEEYPDVDEAMTRVSAALAALDDGKDEGR